MRMGNIIGSSNFRGAANAAAMSEECARTMPRTAIVAFCTMMRTSYWKLGRLGIPPARPAETDDARHSPAHADEAVVWSESGTECEVPSASSNV